MDKQLSCSKNSPFKQNETGNGGYPGDLKRTSVRYFEINAVKESKKARE